MTRTVRFTYTNWRGETAERRVVPVDITFRATEWHREPQWILHALDVEKAAYRDFAMADIKNWTQE